jgi:hypothetical protein
MNNQELLTQYLINKYFQPTFTDWWNNNSFICSGLTLNGNGCYFIMFGNIFQGQVSTRIQFFEKLNRYNINEETEKRKK